MGMPRRTRHGYVGSNWGSDRTQILPLSREHGRHRSESGCGLRAVLWTIFVIMVVAACAVGLIAGMRMI